MISVAVLTISDSCWQGKRDDVSGRTIQEILPESVFTVTVKEVVPDDRGTIATALRESCRRGDIDLVLTTGGTGLGPRDVTPEATLSVCERIVPGLGEIMRAQGWKKTKRAILSRSTAGICNGVLIVNLPGSPKGVAESLQILLDVLPHALAMMLGGGH